MNSEKDNITKVDFGTTQPNTVELTEEEEKKHREYVQMCFTMGESVLEWAMYAKETEYINHMMELYNHFHPKNTAKSKIEVPENQIIVSE